MSEFGAPSAAEAESWFDREDASEAQDMTDGPTDPQEWINQLIEELLRAEQGSFGSGPRDALMARIKLAQAYSELGDSVSAAPLAVENVAQAEELFPSSEGMLAQLREFRDAACEAAGWTAAMMRTAEPEPEPVPVVPAAAVAESVPEPMLIDELVEALVEAEPVSAAPIGPEQVGPESVQAEPIEPDQVKSEPIEPEPTHASWTADSQGVVETPSALAVPEEPPIEDAEEVHPTQASGSLDLAAYEEIIRLRYELRDAQRTIGRLRHTNRKLREALEYEPE